MEKNVKRGLTIGKNLLAMCLLGLSATISLGTLYILTTDLSYMNLLEVIKTVAISAFIVLIAEGLKTIKIK